MAKAEKMGWKSYINKKSVAMVTATDEFSFRPIMQKHNFKLRVKNHDLTKKLTSSDENNSKTSDQLSVEKTENFEWQKIINTSATHRLVRRNAMKKRLTSYSKRMAQRNLLFDLLLSNQLGLCAFRWFLESEKKSNNLEFWLECEKFKQAEVNLFPTISQKILKTYVNAGATKQVKLPRSSRRFLQVKAQECTRDMFERAQQRIYQLMNEDSFARFSAKFPKLITYIETLHALETPLQMERGHLACRSSQNHLTKKKPSLTVCRVTLRRTSAFQVKARTS